jgi:hypothetical protein
MLRLTRTLDTRWILTIKLEGKLSGPWVDEVRKACATAPAPFRRMTLDLSSLTYVDPKGTSLLRELIAGGVEVERRSSYVAELLRSSERERPNISH